MTIVKYIFFILCLHHVIGATAQRTEGNRSISQQTILKNFDSVISRASSALSQHDFDKAKDYYKQAALLKPQSSYRIKMIQYIESNQLSTAKKQAEALDIRRKSEINGLMTNALKAIMDKNYDSARTIYSKILTLNPLKSQYEFAQQKIQAIDMALSGSKKNLNEKAAINTTTTNRVPVIYTPSTSNTGASTSAPNSGNKETQMVETMVIKANDPNTKVKGDSASISNSISTPNAARDKPTQNAARPSIEHNNQTIKEKVYNDSTAASRFKEVATATAFSKVQLKTIKTEVDRLMDDALTAILNQNYEGARIVYYRVLTTGASKQQKEFAKKKIEAIDFEIKKRQKTLPETNATQATDKKVTTNELPAKKIESREFDSSTNTSKNSQLGNRKNDSTSFTVSLKIPTLQQKVAVDKSRASYSGPTNEQIALISSRILAAKGKLDLSDSCRGVKLVCEGVTVDGISSFMKFVIRNDSNYEEFVPGSTQLLYIKNYGILQRLSSRYVTEFKTVPPKGDLAIVYVTETPLAVTADEVFIFEMEDKFKKTKLTINIPGEAYLN
jgi:hypothetical protein